ncbi:MAG: hypothetical protein KIT18_07360 [Burkholderiales bacterium]|nr:hypothetical protein [Burkholderiales bacterium]
MKTARAGDVPALRCDRMLQPAALPRPVFRLETHDQPQATPLGKSKKIVYRLAALFSLIDAFGGFAVQSRAVAVQPTCPLAAAGTIFFWAGILTAFSHRGRAHRRAFG